MKNNKKGFTIIELVIVIAVIAILAAVLIPTFSGIISKANISAAEQEARNAYTQYMSDHAVDAGDQGFKLCIKTSKGYYVFINNGSVQTSKTIKPGDSAPEPTEGTVDEGYVIAFVSNNTVETGSFEKTAETTTK